MKLNANNNYIVVSALPRGARKELWDFYAFLKTKYSENNRSQIKNHIITKSRFDSFLSTPIKINGFTMLDREERNKR